MTFNGEAEHSGFRKTPVLSSLKERVFSRTLPHLFSRVLGAELSGTGLIWHDSRLTSCRLLVQIQGVAFSTRSFQGFLLGLLSSSAGQ